MTIDDIKALNFIRKREGCFTGWSLIAEPISCRR